MNGYPGRPPPRRPPPNGTLSQTYRHPRSTLLLPATRGIYFQQPRPRRILSLCDLVNVPQGVGGVRCYWALLVPQYSSTGPGGSTQLELKFVYVDPVLSTHLGPQTATFLNRGLIDLIHPSERERECCAERGVPLGMLVGGEDVAGAPRACVIAG